MSLIAIVFYILILSCVLGFVAYVPIPNLPSSARIVASILVALFAIVWLGNRLGVIHTAYF